MLLVAGGLTLVHMTTGEIVEPMVMGRTLNLSSLVIMLALTFWAMVWGIVGTFLAVPLMVVILIICSKVPMLRPVAILLSSDGDLEAERLARNENPAARRERPPERRSEPRGGRPDDDVESSELGHSGSEYRGTRSASRSLCQVVETGGLRRNRRGGDRKPVPNRPHHKDRSERI